MQPALSLLHHGLLDHQQQRTRPKPPYPHPPANNSSPSTSPTSTQFTISPPCLCSQMYGVELHTDGSRCERDLGMTSWVPDAEMYNQMAGEPRQRDGVPSICHSLQGCLNNPISQI
jgi:hypothetical protein